MRKTLKYKLYRNRRNKQLVQQLDIAGQIWNHCLALQRRAYRLNGAYINRFAMAKHIARLRRYSESYSHWQLLGSQAVQGIVERQNEAYQEFFRAIKRGQFNRGRPSFKKVKKYRSFTLKQAGWKLIGGNRIRIGKYVSKFALSRPVDGDIKTVTIKRDSVGELWICFSIKVEDVDLKEEFSTGKIGGFDFGLKTFLTNDEGITYSSPEFLKRDLNNIARSNRELSRKKKGSRNRLKAKRKLAKAHIHIANKRRDFQFKLARQLAIEYDILCFEDLNIKQMVETRFWGRKVSDLGFATYLNIQEHMAATFGKEVVKINRWEPTTQECSECGSIKQMKLSEREYVCENCGIVIDRDQNAAINIKRVGASTLHLGDDKTCLHAVAVRSQESAVL